MRKTDFARSMAALICERSIAILLALHRRSRARPKPLGAASRRAPVVLVDAPFGC
jgi:hypothetical protein